MGKREESVVKCKLCGYKMNFDGQGKYITDGHDYFHVVCYFSDVNKVKINELRNELEGSERNYYNIMSIYDTENAKRSEAQRQADYYQSLMLDIATKNQKIRDEILALQGGQDEES